MVEARAADHAVVGGSSATNSGPSTVANFYLTFLHLVGRGRGELYLYRTCDTWCKQSKQKTIFLTI